MAEEQRKECLDLIRSFRDRESQRNQRHGITLKALIVAAVALLWHVFPNIGLALQGDVKISEVFALSGLLVSVLILSLFLFNKQSNTSRLNVDGYRINPQIRNQSFIFLSLYIIFIFGTPVLLLYPINSSFVDSPFLDFSKWLTISIFLLLTGVALLIVGIEKRSFLKYGMPSLILSTPPNNQWTTRGPRIVLVVCIFIALILNVQISYQLGISVLKVNHDQFLTSLNIAFLFFITAAIPQQCRRNGRDERLERLEVEVVLGNKSTEDLVRLIEDEILGIEFGEWMARRIDSLRALKEALEERSRRLHELTSELNDIEPQYYREKLARFEEFFSSYSDSIGEYVNDAQRFVQWMDSIILISAVRTDPGLLRTLQRYYEDFKKDFEEMSRKRREDSEAIERFLSEVRTQSAANGD